MYGSCATTKSSRDSPLVKGLHPDRSKSPDPIEETHYQFFDFRFSLRQGSGNETNEGQV